MHSAPRALLTGRLLKPALFALLVMALAGGCALGPDYKKPMVNSPANYRFATGAATTNSLGDLPWWEVFRDPKLQDLIRVAVTNNYNLQSAVARVEKARQQSFVARSQFFPQISYGGDIGRGQNALFNAPSDTGGATRSSALIDAGAIWEIDFWGRIRRLNESARAQYLATDEARRGVMTTLVADVATAYFRLLELDRELEVQRAATNAFAGSYRIFNDRFKAGAGSRLGNDRAEAAYANAAAAIPLLEREIATTENQISVLVGRNPGPVARGTLGGHAPLPPEVPAGLPSDLLRRRPDLLAAEDTLISANADIGANLANFFPQIGLTTFLGRGSSELSEFASSAGIFWNVGGTLTGPIFQGGALRAKYRAAKARFDEALAAYQQTVLAAFQEVSDTLITRQKLAERRVFDDQAVAALESSVQLSMQRYINGRSSYYEVLQAQQELYVTQQAQVLTEGSELTAVVRLYRALGGGWQTAASEAAEK